MAKFNEISEFLGGPREVEISEGKSLTIYPLKVKDLTELSPANFEELSNEDKSILGHKMILKSLNDPEVSLEDIGKLPASVFTKLMEGINEFNGFTEKNEQLGAVKEKIARARETRKE